MKFCEKQSTLQVYQILINLYLFAAVCFMGREISGFHVGEYDD
jgi:hypothetical protein